MKGGDWFVLALTCMEASASLSFFLINRDWRQGLIWLGATITNGAYLAMTTRMQ